MKLSTNQRKGAGLTITGLVGWFTGQWLPPEVVGQLVGGLVGLV